VEFLVEFEIAVPDGTAARDVEVRQSTEASAAAKLVDEGNLVRAWNPPQRRARSRPSACTAPAAKRSSSVYSVLYPLWDCMRVTVTPLEPHPNDPEALKTGSAAAWRGQ
jgi:muconolactone D-isomerase